MLNYVMSISRHLITMLVGGILVLFLFGCDTSSPKRFETTTEPIIVEQNEHFQIAIYSHPLIFSRKIDDTYDKNIIQYISMVHEHPSNPRPGNDGKDIYTFRAIGKGQTQLTITDTPINSADAPTVFTFSVTVR